VRLVENIFTCAKACGEHTFGLLPRTTSCEADSRIEPAFRTVGLLLRAFENAAEKAGGKGKGAAGAATGGESLQAEGQADVGTAELAAKV
jgi:hypothetical protein